MENTIAHNHAVHDGGGIFSGRDGSPTKTNISLIKNIITHNTAVSGGAGLYSSGSNALLKGNIISHNLTDAYGGGAAITYGEAVIILNNQFIHNQAHEGGAIFLLGNTTGQIFNNIIAKNQANHQGNALKILNSTLQFSHNTIASNRGEAPSGIIVSDYNPDYPVSFFNTILVDHQIGIYAKEKADISLTDTLWGEGPLANDADWDGPGTVVTAGNNIWVDPGFIDPDNNDYHLQETSPAVDAGSDAGITTDIDNQHRPSGLGFDLGADEVPGSIAITKQTPHTFVAPGQAISYTITVSNASNITQHVIITDILPNHVTYNGSAVLPGQVITWVVPPVPPAGTWQEILVLNISPDYVGPLVNIAKATNQAGEIDVATSRVLVSRQTIDVAPNQGATIIALDNNGLTTTIEIPASAVSEPTHFVYTALETVVNNASQFSFIGHGFRLQAQQTGSVNPLPGYTFNTPARVTIQYQDDNLTTANEETFMALRWWDGTTWLDAAETCSPASTYTRDTVNNIISVNICHLTDFALFKNTHQLFLPTIMHNHEPGRLTASDDNDIQPAISSDNQTIIFLSDREGQMDIFRWPNTNLSQTTDAAEDTPIFSLDGQQIIFALDRAGDWDIYQMDLDGTNVRRLIGTAGSNELHPVLTPDGQHLVFTSDLADGNWDIYISDLNDADWIRLTTNPDPDRFPSVSPDGTTILFRNKADANSDLYTMTLNGSNLQQLTTDASFDDYSTFTPDGNGVLFVSNRSGLSEIYTISLADQSIIKVVDLPGWEMNFPRLAADGETVVYARRLNNGHFNIYQASLNTP